MFQSSLCAAVSRAPGYNSDEQNASLIHTYTRITHCISCFILAFPSNQRIQQISRYQSSDHLL